MGNVTEFQVLNTNPGNLSLGLQPNAVYRMAVLTEANSSGSFNKDGRYFQ